MEKKIRVSETPATALLRAHRVVFTEHRYIYMGHGGAHHSAALLGVDPFRVIKTLILQESDAKPMVMLMHGNRKVSTKNLARQIGAKVVMPCTPEAANRHSGYLVGGTSPFATRRSMPLKFNTFGTQVVDFIGNGFPIVDYKAGLERFSGVGSANSKAANSDF